MADEKDRKKQVEADEAQELELDALKAVTGGSIADVIFTETTDISEDTKEKI